MGDFVTNPSNDIFPDKTSHPGVTLPFGWTNNEVARVSDLQALKNAAKDLRDAAVANTGSIATETSARVAAIAAEASSRVAGDASLDVRATALEVGATSEAGTRAAADLSNLAAAKTAGGRIDVGYDRSGFKYLMLRNRTILDVIRKDWTRWIYCVSQVAFTGGAAAKGEVSNRDPWLFRVSDANRRTLIGIKRTATGEEVHIAGVKYGSAPASASTDFALFGDSLTTTSQGYSATFAALYPARSTTIAGLGGQRTAEIAARLGAPTTCVVTGGSIPASGAVGLTGLGVEPFYHNGAIASARCDLYGVKGVLSCDATAAVYTFTRATAGNAIAVPATVALRLTSVHVSGSTDPSAQPSLLTTLQRVAILWMGRNDFREVTFDLNTSLANVASAVAQLRHLYHRVLVLGTITGELDLTAARSPTVGTSPDDTESKRRLDNNLAFRSALAAKYADDYLGMEEAAEAAGYANTFNLSGTNYRVLNLTLLPDGVHPTTSLGKDFFAGIVKAKLDEKGW